MSSLPIIIQIMIVCGFFILSIPVVIVLLKNKGEVKVKNVSLSFGHKALADPNVKSIADYMTDKLEQIRQKLYSGYLKIQKENGCPDEILSENEDSEFVNQMLGNIVWSGNGINSIKSIFEKSFLDRSFLSVGYQEFLDNTIRSVHQNAQKYINLNYRTMVNYPDGSTRERIVSQKEWIDNLQNCMNEIRPIIDGIITFARGQYKTREDDK